MSITGKRWSARFVREITEEAVAFGASIPFDHELYAHDIKGSLAYAHALEKVGILTAGELQEIQKGLREIEKDIEKGKFTFREDLEDIHSHIEHALISRIGEAGGKLHTGRSRNDQVATDLRLWCIDRLGELISRIQNLENTLLGKATEWIDVVMPGYTHLQRAQPVLLSHHLLAYVEMFKRDEKRAREVLKRTSVLPLGSGALAGNAFGIDRYELAAELGFERVSHNSLDAVSDRDFAVECAHVGSLIMVHLSRLAEELIIWSSKEFGFIKLPHSFCTGSSMMPQKVNPDIPELIRGKSGRVFGHLVGLLTMLKGLPLAYNKDLQEDKEPLFDLFKTILPTLSVIAAFLQETGIDRKRIGDAASDEEMLTTDIADALVKKGIPFRKAHEIVARLVREAEEKGIQISGLPSSAVKRMSTDLTPEIFRKLSPRRSTDRRQTIGGTALRNVLREIRRHQRRLSK